METRRRTDYWSLQGSGSVTRARLEMQIVALGQGKATWKMGTLVNRPCDYAHLGSKMDTGLQGFARLSGS